MLTLDRIWQGRLRPGRRDGGFGVERRDVEAGKQRLDRLDGEHRHRHVLGTDDETDRVAEFALQQNLGALHLGDDIFGLRLRDPTRRSDGPGALGERCRLCDLGHFAVFNNENPGADERGNLGITKLAKEAEDIAVDGLLPNAVAVAQVAAHERRFDPGVQSGGIEGQQSAFAISGNGNGHAAGLVFRLHPVHERKDLLQLIADDVSAHFIAHPVDPLPMRNVGLDVESGIAREFMAATDEHRHHHFAAELGKTQRHL